MAMTMNKPENPDFVVQTEGLCKRYGRKLALDNMTLRLERSHIHAIVGANGAGKSTLFRILLGFLPATSGQACILGRDSRHLTPADRGRIGFVNEEHTLPDWMRVAAVMAMQRHHYPRWNQRLLYSNAAENCTVIYCSHQMEEVERVADNLVILERGRLVNMSAPDEFRARVSQWVADIPFKGPEPSTIPGLLQAQRIDGLHHYLVLDQGEPFAHFLRAAGARSVQSMPVSLDRAVNGFLTKNHAMPAAA